MQCKHQLPWFSKVTNKQYLNHLLPWFIKGVNKQYRNHLLPWFNKVAMIQTNANKALTSTNNNRNISAHAFWHRFNAYKQNCRTLHGKNTNQWGKTNKFHCVYLPVLTYRADGFLSKAKTIVIKISLCKKGNNAVMLKNYPK